MRIGVDIRALDTKYTTGVDTYLGKLLEYWAADSGGNTFALLGTKNLANHPLVLKMTQKGHKFFAPMLNSRIFNGSMKFLNFPRLDRLVGGADVFFLPNTMFHAFSKSCKTVITFHDLSYERLKWVYSVKRNFWHTLVNPKKEAKRATRIIAVSDSTARDLRELYGTPQDKIDVVPLGVDYESFNKASACDRMDVPRRYILFLGSIEPRKNLSSLVIAFNRLKPRCPDLHLVVAGDFFPQKDKNALKLLKQTKDAVLLRSVSEEDKKCLLQNALMTVLPSFYEGFGLPILESFAAGTPVVTSSSSSMPEVAGGAAILVNPFNLLDIEQGIETLLTNEQLRNNLISRGRDIAKRYSWEKTARMTLEALEQAVNA